MEAYWNKLSLDKPPTVLWHCTVKDFDSKGFLNTTETIIKALETQTIFRTEAAILSRLIYRMKSKLRSDKGLKNMEKINRALLNYLKVSLENEYKYLAANTKREEDGSALPTRQMLQYVLVRTQGFAKLMCRIENIAANAGEYFRSRIVIGQAWNMSVVAYSVISRIWLLARNLTKKCCKWYDRMYKYHDELKMIGVPWLPENYRLPEDLRTWLNVPWINNHFDKIPENKGLSDGIFTLISQQEDKEDEIEIIVRDKRDGQDCLSLSVAEPTGVSPQGEKSAVSKSVSQIQLNSHIFSLDEVGKRISRAEFTASLPEGNTKARARKKRKIDEDPKDAEIRSREKKSGRRKCADKIKRKALKIENIKTREDLVKLLSLEAYPGLDKLQWKILKKNVKKLLLRSKNIQDNSATVKRDVGLKKIIRSIREWIN